MRFLIAGSPPGLPLYWRDEQSGILRRAVEAYLADQTGGTPCTTEEIRLVRKYLQQWVNAPCWAESVRTVGDGDPELTAELVGLRADVLKLETADQIHDWLMRALDLGIDPL